MNLKSFFAFLVLMSLGLSTYSKNIFYPVKNQSDYYDKITIKKSRFGAATLKYYGGPVISHPLVYVVYWGNSIHPTLVKGLPGFYKALVNSNHMDFLSQYSTNINAVDGRPGTNQEIGRGQYGGEYVINPSNKKRDIDDVEIQAELVGQIAAQKLPAPTDDSLYMVYFPAGMSITASGSKSCSSFCAYHNGVQTQQFGNLFYGVMPDMNSGACRFGCGFSQSVLDRSTIVSAHEFSEAVTDGFPTPGDNPAFPQAWNTEKGEEVGGLCSEFSGVLRTGSTNYKVQGEFDNKTGTCITGPFDVN